MNATEVATVAEKKAVARDNITKDEGKRDIAVAVESLAASGGMGFAGAEGRCGSSGPVICVM